MIRKAIIVLLMVGALGTIAIWVGTYHYYVLDWQSRTTPQLPVLKVSCHAGRCSFNWYDAHDVKIRRSRGRGLSFGGFVLITVLHTTAGWTALPAGFTILRVNGFRHRSLGSFQLSNVKRTCVQFPFWFAFAVLATYPTIAFIRGPLRRYRRRRKGLCVGCGYDLTGNVSGVCPECGAET